MLVRLSLFANLVMVAICCLFMAALALLVPDAAADFWNRSLKAAARPMFEE